MGYRDPIASGVVKRIGLLGGMSWESSAEYYRLVNEATRDRLGGLHSADCLLRSVDFVAVEQLQRSRRLGAGRRAARRRGLRARGRRRRAAGALHQHDAQGRRRDHRRDRRSRSCTSPTRPRRPCRRSGSGPSGCSPRRTRWSRTSTSAGCATCTASRCWCPTSADRRIVHDVIYGELCVGVVDDGSRTQYRRIIGGLAERGAEGILFGCTEIDLLVGPDDSPVPVFDTTRLHAQPRRRPRARRRLTESPGR